MVSIEEWAATWSRDEWAVLPDPNGWNTRNDDGQGWRIVLKADVGKLAPATIGPRYEDEEMARHVARVHNFWLSYVRNLGREPNDGDTVAATHRTPES